jgi:hypothetical protein
MKTKEISKEIESLKRKVNTLSRDIASVRSSFLEDPSPVERMLRSRGLKVFRENPTEKLFFLPDISPPDKDRFYELMKRYSFRLILRDIIKQQERFRIHDLTHYCSLKTAQRYGDLLLKMKMIAQEGKNKFRTLRSPIDSFGPTLEWFISEMFRREFASPAIYGVSVKETPSGGDYDVMASWNRRLVYVEVKSSPPRGIELKQVTAFFSRIEDLIPDVAILFNDTQLRMKDKLVLLFEEELERRHGKAFKTSSPVTRLVGELFHVQNRIFIVNSRKDVVENFSICLKHYLRHGERKPRRTWSPKG